VTGPFQQEPDRRAHRAVIIDDQDFCHSRPSAKSMLACETVAAAAQAFPFKSAGDAVERPNISCGA
jgi:hypothetical protein